MQAKIETYIRVLDAQEEDEAVIASISSEGTASNSSWNPNAGHVISRHSFPSTRSQRPKPPAFSFPPIARDPAAASAPSAWPVLLPQPAHTPSPGSTATRHSAVPHIPTARPLPPLRPPTSERPDVGGDGDRADVHGQRHDAPGTSSDRSGNRLDLITAFLPLLAAIVIAPVAGAVFFLMHRYYKRKQRSSVIKSVSQKIPLEFESSRETSISSESADSKIDFLQQLRAKRSFPNRYQSNDFIVAPFASNENEFDEWEVPRQNLRFTNCRLGEGNFGQVWKCDVIDFHQTGCSETVAVKMLKQKHSEKEQQDLLSELQIMKMLGPHPNVVSLLGCCSDKDPVYLILEYVPCGKLQDFLRKSRKEMVDGSSVLTAQELTSFAYQIAGGMEYITSRGVIFSLSELFCHALIHYLCYRSFTEIWRLVTFCWERTIRVKYPTLALRETLQPAETMLMKGNQRLVT